MISGDKRLIFCLFPWCTGP